MAEVTFMVAGIAAAPWAMSAQPTQRSGHSSGAAGTSSGLKAASKHAAGFKGFQSVLCDSPYSSPLFRLVQQRLLLIRP